MDWYDNPLLRRIFLVAFALSLLLGLVLCILGLATFIGFVRDPSPTNPDFAGGILVGIILGAAVLSTLVVQLGKLIERLLPETTNRQ